MKKKLSLAFVLLSILFINQIQVQAASDITLSNGQVWAGSDAAGAFTWENAKSACTNGYHLPSQPEWAGAYDTRNLATVLGLSLNPDDFSVPAGIYWTSDFLNHNSEKNLDVAKNVYFNTSGYSSVDGVSFTNNLNSVRCIKNVGNVATPPASEMAQLTTGTLLSVIPGGIYNVALAVGESKDYDISYFEVASSSNSGIASVNVNKSIMAITGLVAGPTNIRVTCATHGCSSAELRVTVTNSVAGTVVISPVTPEAPVVSVATTSGTTYTGGCLNLTQYMLVGSSDASEKGEVSTLQKFLIDQGYLTVVTSPTGYFGSQTKQAVMLFQADNNILPIGTVGPLTRAKMQTVSCDGNKNTNSAATSATNLTTATANPITYATTTATTPINTGTANCSTILNNYVDTHSSCEMGQGLNTSILRGGLCGVTSLCTDCKYLTAEQRQVGYNAQTCAGTAAIEYKWTTSTYANFGGKPQVCSPNPTVGSSCSAGAGDCLSSTNSQTVYKCADTRDSSVGYSGKVVDEQGNGLIGVTVTLYKPILGTMAEVVTDSNGNWSASVAYADYAWFHKKTGYDQNSRMGLTTGGKQATWTMKKLKPLSISPSVVELPREDTRTVSMTLNNFDWESDLDGKDLEICAVKNASSCSNFVDYQTYLNNGNTTATSPFTFAGLSNRSSSVTFRYDSIHNNNTGINSVFFAVRRKSNPTNITTGMLNLVNGSYLWQLDGTYNTVRNKTGIWTQPVCASTVSAGASCAVSNSGGTCAIDDSATSWRSFRCGLVGSTVADVTMTPSYSQMNMSTKLPVQIAVNGISNSISNTKVCYEVLAHPNVPSAVNAGRCADLNNYTSFSGNSDWSATANGWIGNIKYDAATYGANGIKVKVYFMDATTRRYAGATIEVIGGDILETADPTAQILWNGTNYAINVDPTNIHTLTWKSTNADTLVQAKVEFTHCENGNSRTIDPWTPWLGGSGNSLNGSSANAGNTNDAGCYVTATYKVKNSVTGKIITSSAFMAYKASADIKAVTLPGGLSQCPSDISGLTAGPNSITCDASGREHQTIGSCVPADYENPLFWNWNKTNNTFEHQTGKSCGIALTPAPTVTFTVNGGQKSVTVKVGDTITRTWSSTNGATYDANWTASGASCAYNGRSAHWNGIDGKNKAGDTESFPATSDQVGCTFTITYKVTSASGQVVSSSIDVTTEAAPVTDTPIVGSLYSCGTHGTMTWQNHAKICMMGIYHQTISDCVPDGYNNPNLWNWNTAANIFEHSTGETCTAALNTSSTKQYTVGGVAFDITAPATCKTLVPISKGSWDSNSNGSVSALQNFLAKKYNLNIKDIVSGYYGDMTVENVKRFQIENNLEAVGYVGFATRALIKSQCSN